ncbi:MAG: penicillin-binding protein [candidate division KSB1 bacterium]|nr:penicillin-binding protein [candidate division KSB1 bacterium]MDZ7274515.1 penicillin-binding protein [candidate division KSB1 bacterium]MDZ7284824.1 penicillin-binding protein [candidate division KSB1 bacterium]MDZ7297756.1 penicillin-binding protein [candidate division KSB1 bacterium]MDZ7308687.1 penicillin-binding protein [candidate division KSB1 bacterium]
MRTKILSSLMLATAGLLLTGMIVFFVVLSDLPYVPRDLRSLVYARPTEIYAADGTLVQRLGGRTYVTLDKISPNFLNAVIATEDADFYRHRGLDKLGLLRGAYRSLTGHPLQSGSTITQQLSKYLFFSFEKSFGRKLKEILISLQLEATFSKREILEAYCNLVYFGGAAHGVEDAARQYFNKSAAELNVSEAAMLAGILNSPQKLNPFSYFDNAKARQRLVLYRMMKEGYLTEAQRQQAAADSIHLSRQRSFGNDFIDYVISEAQARYGREPVQYGGLRIYTTLDPMLQAIAEQEVEAGTLKLEAELDSTGQPLQAALVALAVPTGEVKALVGARRYVPAAFNRAVEANRHVGSCIKPLVYLTALEQLRVTPRTLVHDTLTTLRDANNRPYRPRNFDRRYHGQMVLKAALMKSLNVISAQLTAQVTPAKVVETARRMGISTPVEEVISLALGTAGMSPLELAAAYAVIANNGVYHRPVLIKRVEDVNGVVLDREYSFGETRFDARITYQLLDMMRGVIEGGTGRIIRALGFTAPAAGKTGTSTDYTDAWFTGFTTSLATAVWVGYDRDAQMRTRDGRGVDGGRGAAPIWAGFMKRATAFYPAREFTMPPGLKTIYVHPEKGWEVVKPEDGLPVVVPEEAAGSVYP